MGWLSDKCGAAWNFVKPVMSQVYQTVTGQLISTLAYTGVNRLFATSPTAIAAVGLIGTVNTLLSTTSPTIGFSSVLFQESVSKEAMHPYFKAGLVISAVSAGVLTGIGWYAGDIFQILGHSAAVAQEINAYFRAFLETGGLFPSLAMLAIRGVYAKLGWFNCIMWTNIGNAALCLGASTAVYFMKPKPDNFGYALSVASWITGITSTLHVAYAKGSRDLQLFSRDQWWEWDRYQKLLSKGTKIMVGLIAENLFINGLFGLLGRKGEEATAAFAVANQMARFPIMMTVAMRRSLNFLYNQERSDLAGRLSLLKEALAVATLTFAAPLAVWSLAAPESFIALFSKDIANTSEATLILRIVAVGGILDATRLVTSFIGSILEIDNQILAINLISLGVGFGVSTTVCFRGGSASAMIASFYGGVSAAALLQGRKTYVAIVQKNSDQTLPFFGVTCQRAHSVKATATATETKPLLAVVENS